MKLIDIKKITFEYFRRDTEGNVTEMIEALKDVSLDVKQGQFVAILGRNGSGKSTLAKHINALLLPEEGTVVVDGMDTSREELRLSIRQTAGMVFQNPDNQIVGNLVEEDVAFGPENIGVPTGDIWNRVDAALKTTDMEAYRTQSPNHLSGGQKQRVAIAGVLAMQPKCIIFDEATAMLDPQGRQQMIGVAKQLQKEHGITILLITHHMDEVMAADRVFVMKDGAVVGDGTPREIFAMPQLLEACGLMLPATQRYARRFLEAGILTEQEAQAATAEELSQILADRYLSVGNIPDRTQNVSGMLPDTQPEQKLTEGILLDKVSYVYNKGYDDERVALKNVSMFIGKNEFVAVIGHTGSGKSTLMQHLNGLYLPTEGTVYFNGKDIADKDFSLKKLRQKVGLVFQYPEYQLFAETVEKDVCFGPENMNITKIEAQKRAYEAIAAVGLPDTIYDYSPLQLSGGQKRRVAIAGVLAMHPEYLVLDEPTAGLDPASARALLQMLKGLQEREHITIVIVSHSMEEVAEYADRILVMEQGEKVMDDTVERVFMQRKELEAVGLQVPTGILLLQGLAQAGIPVDLTKCRFEEICREIIRVFTDNRNS